MIYRDVCKNSVFLTELQKKQFNKKINKYFEVLENEFKDKNIQGNLYYTGSLARQEPSVEITKGDIKLSSDIDFVVVMKDGNKSCEINADYLNKKYPEFINSVAVVNNSDMKKITSFFARDLHSALDYPIYKSFEVTRNKELSVGGEDHYDATISQMACLYLHPEKTGKKNDSITFREEKYHVSKLALECLRFHLFNNNIKVFGYNNIYDHFNSGVVKDVIEPSKVQNLLKSRELAEYNKLKEVDLVSLIKTVMNDHLGKRFNSTVSLKELVDKKSKESKDIINSFQCGLMAFVIGTNETNVIKRTQWLKSFKEIMSNMDRSQVNVCKKLNYLTSIDWERKGVIKNKLLMNDAINIMRELRLDFVNALHRRNTKEHSWGDLAKDKKILNQNKQIAV